MSTCKKCKKPLEDGWVACPFCAAKVPTEKKPRKRRRRANGEGTIFPRGKTYSVRITIGWKKTGNGYRPIVAEKGGFKTQREAMEYIPILREQATKASPEPVVRHGVDYTRITFKELYDKLMDREKRRIKQSTINCYKSAYKYFSDIYHLPFCELNTEDWQLCIDDCPHGIRTKENMKALGTKMYKFAAELRVFGLSTSTDFATMVWLDREEKESRQPFTLDEVTKIKDAVTRKIPFADYVLAMCYTGFRPSEFLALERDAYDPVKNTLRGGAKTEAGKNRIVPVHPLIKAFVAERYMSGKKFLFGDSKGAQLQLNHFRTRMFYPALEAAGIQKAPEEGDKERPERTPYSCRHTFATLMKSVPGAAKDKAALMGHTSYEMTLHYQHEDYESLKSIVEKIA
ncbi:MAG: tyrosine-type recombinase/integrase [Clostridia bacterium]|nr:tyrosine-type recombinase/integrase [Clostridia bacterium]